MEFELKDVSRREFVRGAWLERRCSLRVRLAFAAAAPSGDQEAVFAQIPAQHDATVKMLQDWIALPSIAAENRNYPAGPEYMAKLAKDAGFQHVELVPTAGKSGVFATLDVGAPTTLGIYFMYDVKQFDPAEWSSPPLEARLVDKPGLGKVIVGRGATNSKGPQTAVLAALHAFKASGQEAAGEHRAGVRGRGGDCFAALPRDCVQAGD